MSNKWMTVGLIAVAIIAIGGYFYPHIVSSLGATGTRFPNGLAVGTTASVTQNKMTIGNSGTAIGNLIFGTCSLTLSQGTASFTQTGTTTAAYDCSATGVIAGDNVFAQLATSTISTTGVIGGWTIEGVSASTTADSIRINIRNNTGLSSLIPQSIASSSVKWFVLR